MSGTTVNRAVLCDDDEVLRGVVRRLVEDIGFLVVAETADPASALDSVERTAADVVLLDLALQGGRGEDVISELATRGRPVRVVVFSAYGGAGPDLVLAGATAVVEKPDFETLEQVLRQLHTAGGESDRRRPPPRPAPALPPVGITTVDGFEPWKSFLDAVDALAPGDALLALDIVPDDASREVWDHVFALDHRIALARSALAGGRTAERASLSPAGVAVLTVVGGHPEAPAAVFARIERTWTGAGCPVGAFGHVTGARPPASVLDGILVAVDMAGDDLAHPLRMV